MPNAWPPATTSRSCTSRRVSRAWPASASGSSSARPHSQVSAVDSRPAVPAGKGRVMVRLSLWMRVEYPQTGLPCAREPPSGASIMPAQIIDGVALSAQMRGALKQRVAALAARGRQPGLAVVLVGENPASKVYVRNKIKACAEAGIHSELFELPESAPEAQVLERIRALNADPRIHGILVQLPL